MRFFILAALALATCACSGSRTSSPENAKDTRSSPTVEASAPPASSPGPAAAEPPAKDDRRHVLVVFGDSLSAGFGLETGQSFPDDMQRTLDSEGAPWRV